MGNGRSRPLLPSEVIEQALRRDVGAGAELRAVPIEQVMEENTSLNFITDIVVFPGIFTVTHAGHLKLVDAVLSALEEERVPPRDALLVVMPYGSSKHAYFRPPDDSETNDWRLLPDAVFDYRIPMLCAAMATLNRPQRVFVCNDMLGDMGDSGRIMEAYELIRTMASYRWPEARIHCLCGSDSLGHIQHTMVKASSPKRTAVNMGGGQSIFCVSVGDEPTAGRRVGSSRSTDGFAPGQSGEIGRTPSTVETLRVVSAVCHATVEEYCVPNLEQFSTREICESLAHETGAWETQLPAVVANALKEYRDATAAQQRTAKKRTSGKKNKRAGAKK